MSKLFFPMGATYAPLAKATEVDIAEWPDDLERMASTGLNTFRLFVCHDRVEQVRKSRDFSRIDRAFELAEKHHLKVIGNVGGTFANLQAIYAPRWLATECGCTLRQPKPGAPQVLQGNRFHLCYDDPVYQAETRDFLHEAIARYCHHPALLAWSGWNEPRETECHCPHSLQLFRQYLQQKYGDLSTLNAAWSTEFPLCLESWDQVYPQTATGFEYGGYQPWLDWHSFNWDNRNVKFQLIRDWIKEVDPVTPVISHYCSPDDADIFGSEDIQGTSIYTYHGQHKDIPELPDVEFCHRMRVNRMACGSRSFRADPDGFWVVETEAGPVSWVHDMAPRSYSWQKMNVRDLWFVAQGARAILRWLYRSRVSDAQAGEFNLVGWDGRLTPRAVEFGNLSKFLNQHAELFLTHQTADSGIMVLEERRQWDGPDAEGYRYRYRESMRALCEALGHIGVGSRVINDRQLKEGILKTAKVLFVPFRPYVSPEIAAILSEFVNQGGHLIAESPLAIKDDKLIHYEVTPGGLTDLFGAQVFDLEKSFVKRCGELAAFDFEAMIELKGGVAEAVFDSGTPAIVTNTYGKGKTVLYGSVVFQPYYMPEFAPYDYAQGEPLRRELLRRLADAGVSPRYEMEIDPEFRSDVHIIVRSLPQDGGSLWFVLNIADCANAFAVKGIAHAQIVGVSGAADKVAITDDKVNFELAPYGWAVLKEGKNNEDHQG